MNLKKEFYRQKGELQAWVIPQEPFEFKEIKEGAACIFDVPKIVYEELFVEEKQDE